MNTERLSLKKRLVSLSLARRRSEVPVRCRLLVGLLPDWDVLHAKMDDSYLYSRPSLLNASG